MNADKKPLLGLTLTELREVAKELGMPAFAGGQMAEWLYKHRVRSIDQMTNLSKKNRERLAKAYEVGCAAPIDERHSVDGTVKYLFPAAQGKYVEAVYIPDGDRATLCVSSQVGCKMNCLFCQTGKQGFEGQLTTGEILNQVYSLPEADTLTNIVFMGQGEPMDNLEAVLKATQILTADYGWASGAWASSRWWSCCDVMISPISADSRLSISSLAGSMTATAMLGKSSSCCTDSRAGSI